MAPSQQDIAFLEKLWASFTAALNHFWATGRDEDKRAVAAEFTAFFLAFGDEPGHIAKLAQRWEV